MMEYVCTKTLCDLYDACPQDRRIPAFEQSAPDEGTGEILYFAACPELGETFCGLHSDALVCDLEENPAAGSEDDAKNAMIMMNHILEHAIENLVDRIPQGATRRGPTRLVMPREMIDSIKQQVPHQADELETTFADFANNGFEPQQFIEPDGPFMENALIPFRDDFFVYRREVGEYYGSDVAGLNEINGNKAKFRVAWDALFRTLGLILPTKPSIVRAHSTVQRLLQMFERRLSLGDDAVSRVEYEQTLVTLNEKLCDVAADIRELNLNRIIEAETKRQAKAAKRLESKLGCGMQDVATMDDEHAKRCSWIFKALEAHRCQLRAQLEDKRVKPPKLVPPTEEWITSYINVAVFGLKQAADGNFIGKDGDGGGARPITRRQIRTTLQQALGMTINDIKRIYASWKEDMVKQVHHIAEGNPKSQWGKQNSKSYNKLIRSLNSKRGRFDYRIFTYWICLHMEEFVRSPRQLDYKTAFGSVNSVESMFRAMAQYAK